MKKKVLFKDKMMKNNKIKVLFLGLFLGIASQSQGNLDDLNELKAHITADIDNILKIEKLPQISHNSKRILKRENIKPKFDYLLTKEEKIKIKKKMVLLESFFHILEEKLQKKHTQSTKPSLNAIEDIFKKLTNSERKISHQNNNGGDSHTRTLPDITGQNPKSRSWSVKSQHKNQTLPTEPGSQSVQPSQRGPFSRSKYLQRTSVPLSEYPTNHYVKPQFKINRIP